MTKKHEYARGHRCSVCDRRILMDFESNVEQDKLWHDFLELRSNVALNDDAFIPTAFIFRCPKCLDRGIDIIKGTLDCIKAIHEKAYVKEKNVESEKIES